MLSEDVSRRLPSGVLAAAVASWSAVATLLVAHQWFFGDDFDFLLNRSLALRGDHGLLAPHNEHWCTLPILVFRLNVAVFGLHHYLPYAVLPPALHVAATVLVFLLLRREGSRGWTLTLTALVVLFLGGGAGWENTLWDFQIVFLGAGAAGLLALLVLAGDPPRSRDKLVAVVALIAALMCSGIGLLMVFWVGAYLTIRHGVRAALEVVVVPALLFLVWFATIGRGHHGAPPPDVSIAWRAALKGMAHVWSAATLVPGAGIAILLALAATVALRRSSRLFPLAASGLATLAFSYALFGYTRSGMGVDATTMSRYAYFGVVFCAPAVAIALETCAGWLARRSARTAPVVWATCALLVVVIGSGQLMAKADAWRTLTSPDKARLAAVAGMVDRHEDILRPESVPLFVGGYTAEVLAPAAVERSIPRVPRGHKTELDVAGRLQVDVRASPFGLPLANEAAWESGSGHPGAVTHDGRYRCETVSGAVRRSVTVSVSGRGAQLRVTTDGPSLSTALVSGDLVGEEVRWPVTPGQPVFVASTAQRASLRIGLPPGTATVCGG